MNLAGELDGGFGYYFLLAKSECKPADEWLMACFRMQEECSTAMATAAKNNDNNEFLYVGRVIVRPPLFDSESRDNLEIGLNAAYSRDRSVKLGGYLAFHGGLSYFARQKACPEFPTGSSDFVPTSSGQVETRPAFAGRSRSDDFGARRAGPHERGVSFGRQMRKLNFTVAKSRKAFHKNYQLHDLAQFIGERWLKRWGFTVHPFGEDIRKESVWAAGEDKPDVLVAYRGIPAAFVDWKAKSSRRWWLNRRAYDSYRRWGQRCRLPVIVAFGLFDRKTGKLKKFKFVELTQSTTNTQHRKAWDRNAVVEFSEEQLLPFRRDHFTSALNC